MISGGVVAISSRSFKPLLSNPLRSMDAVCFPSVGRTQNDRANTTQRTPEKRKRSAAPDRRAHETSPGFCPAKQKWTGLGAPRSWRPPSTPPAIHAHYLLLYFSSQSAMRRVYAHLHPLLLLTTGDFKRDNPAPSQNRLPVAVYSAAVRPAKNHRLITD